MDKYASVSDLSWYQIDISQAVFVVDERKILNISYCVWTLVRW